MLKTIRLRVEEGSADELLITLTARAAADAGWGSALATARIPADLSHLPAPQLDGQPATPEAIRGFLLTGPGADPLAEIGMYLGGILLPDAIRAGLTEHATADDARIVLDVEPAELRMLPWEMALNPDDPGPLFLDQRVAWSRLVEAPAAAGPADCWPLLRVLVVVGVNAGHPEEDDIAAKLEVERIRDELDRYAGFVDYEILDRPPSDELGQQLIDDQPHIFHFIGHGTTGTGTGGALRVRPKGSQAAWWWTPGQIATKFQRHVPRLVVLNACRTADLSAQRGTWNVIDAFVKRGVPAVVAMQGDIRGDAAAAFSGALYRALGDGAALDVAVARARDRVSDTVPGSHQVWLPSLTFTSAAEAAFPRRYALDQDDLDRILAAKGKFEKIRAFVDRTEERREIWQTVCTLDAPPRVIALQGDSLAGKSAFAKWLIGSMALRGRNAAYVELAQNVGTLGLLGRIAEELAGFPKQRASNEAVFDEWLREVDRLQRRDPPGPSAPVGEGRYDRRLEPNGPETLAGDVVGMFADALDRAAGGEPLVLAIDPVARIDTGAWDEYIVPNLIERIADRRAHIQLILVVRTGSLTQLLRQRQRVLDVVKDVTIEPLPSDQKEVLIRQYMLGRGYDPEKFQQYVEPLAQERSWTSELFTAFETLASSLRWRPS